MSKKERISTALGMARNCVFNRFSDVEKVLSGLAVSLPDAIRTGVVKDVDIPDSTNGLTSPDDISGRVRDNFDAVDMLHNVNERGRAHKSRVEAAAAAAAASSSAAAAAAAAGE